jgi:putative effector of murein hydrolase
MTDVLRNMGLFVATLAVFEAFRALQNRTRKVWQNPLLLSFVAIGVALTIAKVPMADYREATRPLGWLVGPSVVALGLTLEGRLDDLIARARMALVSLSAGALVGAISATGIARLLGASRVVCASLAPKSATTAIAAPVSERIGGDPSLTAVVVILVGVFGALVGPTLLRMAGVRDRYAFGLAMGGAAHLVGTSRARDEGPVEESASAAAMVVHGVLTALAAWVSVRTVAP